MLRFSRIIAREGVNEYATPEIVMLSRHFDWNRELWGRAGVRVASTLRRFPYQSVLRVVFVGIRRLAGLHLP